MTTTNRAPSPVWQAFANPHRGNPFLDLNPLYSLHEGLIDIISGKAEGSRIERRGVAPEFLTDAEVAFERDLARAASGGFFHQNPFFWRVPGEPLAPLPPASSPVDGPPPSRKKTRAKKVKSEYDVPPDPLLFLFPPASSSELLGKIKELRADLLQLQGLSRLQIHAHFAMEDRYKQLLDLRAVAYVSWLVMNEQFRRERDGLREECGRTIELLGGFPAVPGSELESDAPQLAPGQVFIRLMDFYGRWGLETFLTWDLPVPMRAALFSGTHYDRSLSAAAGVNVFVPWYVLRDGQLDLMELTRQQKKANNTDHLGGWMETATAAKDKQGDVRLRNAMVLYLYEHLALQSRYADRPGWTTIKQDEVFARFLGLSDESIRRVRLHLQKHIGSRK